MQLLLIWSQIGLPIHTLLNTLVNLREITELREFIAVFGVIVLLNRAWAAKFVIDTRQICINFGPDL